MIRILPVFAVFLCFAAPLQAFLWWGKSNREVSPAEQTERARPFYDEALQAQRDGNQRRALRAYERIYKNYPAADFAAQSMFNYAVIQFERKKWKKSHEIFQTILLYHPSFPRFNDIIDYQFRIALALSDGDNMRFLLVIPYRAYNRAIEQFEAIINNAPYSQYAPLALMNIALIRQYRNETTEAIDALDRLINNYPSSLLAEDAYLTLAQTFAGLVQGPEYDQGATREAISYFEDFLILFSSSDRTAEAESGLSDMRDVHARSKLIIGEYYLRYRRWYRSAEIFLNEAITIAPDSPAAQTARRRLAEIEQRRNPAEEAARSPEDRQAEETFLKRLLRRLGRSS